MDASSLMGSSSSSDAPTTGEHRMGTTIVGVCYDGGVILAADSRTSTGMYVANRASDKISQLTDNVYVCRSGSAADTQVISDYVRYFLHQHTIQSGQPATVKVASNLVRLLAYQNKSMLQAGMIVGGWDKYEGGQIYSVPLGGTILRQPFAIGGSGSSYLYGLMDHEWKEGMTQEEAEKFVVKVVSLAIARDGASGGVVRTVTDVEVRWTRCGVITAWSISAHQGPSSHRRGGRTRGAPSGTGLLPLQAQHHSHGLTGGTGHVSLSSSTSACNASMMPCVAAKPSHSAVVSCLVPRPQPLPVPVL